MTPKETLTGSLMIIGACTLIILFIFAMNTLWDANLQTSSTTPPSKIQLLSDEEYMRIGINDYLMSNFDTPYFPKPDYDVALEDQAVDNAIRGENVWIRVSGNTAEEALKTLTTLDTKTYTCDQASFWLTTNKRDNPGTKYAIGVYKTSYNQYNLSIVTEKPQPDTQEMNRNGAWITIKHNPVISNFETYCHRWD